MALDSGLSFRNDLIGNLGTSGRLRQLPFFEFFWRKRPLNVI